MNLKNNFAQRALTGTLFVTAVAGCTLFNHWSFFILLFVVNFLCLMEFFELILPDKSRLEKYLGIVAGCIIYGMFALIFSADLSLAWYYHIIPVFMVMFIVKLYENTNNEFTTLAFQIMGLLYITMPLVMLTKIGFINSFEYSSGLPMGFFLLLWTSDTGAYLAGRSLGKHKLFERVSPKKTWEGSLGGILLVSIVAYTLSRFSLFDAVNTTDWLIIGVLIVVFGTYGDLFESLLKRNLRIKDSGTILPGHGGVLDRFDGLFLSVPAIFFYLLFTN